MGGKMTAQRVLLIRPSALGDVCRTVPVLASLARHWPDSTFGWLVQDGFEDAIRCHPDLDEVVVFPRKDFKRWSTRPTVLARSVKWMAGLRRGRWDCVVDCQGLVRSGLMSLASGARCRVGDRHGREGAWLAYNRRVKTRDLDHTVDRMLKLLDPLGVEPIHDMRLYPPPEAIEAWTASRQELGVDGAYFALATTTRWPSKAWPDDHWVSYVQSLGDRAPKSFVLLGSPSEQEAVGRLAGRLRDEAGVVVHDLSGRTSVGDVMAVIASARLTVANDTAALHMAVGLGGRCVGLFGPTDPARVGPYGLADRVVYAPPSSRVNYRDARIGDQLMRQVSVDEVVAVTVRVLEETANDSEAAA
ncbi:MAG: glycosyltransferase family 9 protein [Phycisphaerales bacterium]|nr:glycosyltransferase family 9 protein [Phycisphaerales bacterium]